MIIHAVLTLCSFSQTQHVQCRVALTLWFGRLYFLTDCCNFVTLHFSLSPLHLQKIFCVHSLHFVPDYLILRVISNTKLIRLGTQSLTTTDIGLIPKGLFISPLIAISSTNPQIYFSGEKACIINYTQKAEQNIQGIGLEN